MNVQTFTIDEILKYGDEKTIECARDALKHPIKRIRQERKKSFMTMKQKRDFDDKTLDVHSYTVEKLIKLENLHMIRKARKLLREQWKKIKLRRRADQSIVEHTWMDAGCAENASKLKDCTSPKPTSMWMEYLDEKSVEKAQLNSLKYQEYLRFLLPDSPIEPKKQTSVEVASQILERLFLGDYYDAANEKWLKEAHITHILNCTANVVNEVKHLYSETQGTYKRIPAYDHDKFDLLAFLMEATDFINKAIESEEKSNVLVHCAMGISRSTTCVIAYLLRFHGQRFKSVKDALEFVKEKRPGVRPNHGFMEQLELFHAKLKLNTHQQEQTITRTITITIA